MKKRNLCKIMAFAMAGAMAFSTTAFAAVTENEVTDPNTATGTANGNSTVEGYVDPDVFTVVLPVDDSTAPTFNFTLDPQKLLHATDGTNYTDGDATVLFGTKTDTSDALEVKNKGNVVVDVSVTATASNLTDSGYTIPLVADDKFVGDSSTSLYLGLKVGDKDAVALDAANSNAATVSTSLEGVDEDNFEIKVDNSGGSKVYSKVLKSGVTDFPSTSFSMIGACNEKADWSAATAATPSVEVTWTLAKATDVAPTFTAGGLGTINYKKGVGDSGLASIKSVSVLFAGKGYDGYHNGASWKAATDNGKSIVLDPTFLAPFTTPTSTATITYITNNGTTKTATLTVSVLNVEPTFTAGTQVGIINYTKGAGDAGLASIEKVEVTFSGKNYDAYHNGATWTAASDNGSVITLSPDFLAPFVTNTAPATITYITNTGETKTADLTVATKA